MTIQTADTRLLESLIRSDRAAGITRIVAGAVITRADGSVLLLRRSADDFMGGLWELPSGKVDGDEDLIGALIREVFEETGMKLAGVEGYVGSFDYLSGSGKPTRQHTFTASAEAGAVVTVSDEHDQAAWLQPADAQTRVSDAVRAQLASWHTAAAPGTAR